MIDPDNVLVGRQAVVEAIQAGKVQKVMILKDRKGAVIRDIASLAGQRGIPLKYLGLKQFNEIASGDESHQGVVAITKPYKYRDLEDALHQVDSSGRPALILLLDHIQDPQNLGALIRTGEAAGAGMVILPSHRAAGINATVRKVAAGAAEWLPVVRVTNLVKTADLLKKRGFWIYGAEGSGHMPYYRADWKRPVALVLGSEGKGISRLLRERCDLLVYLPMAGKLNSLNVSVAGGILMYEYMRQQADG